MRLDYILYGLGIVFFGLSAASFVVVSESSGQLIYVASTAVLGVLSIGIGVAQGLKVSAQPTIAAPQVTPMPQVEQVTTIPTVAAEPAAVAPEPAIEQPKETAKVETANIAPIEAEAPKVEAPAVVEAPKTEAPTVSVPPASEVKKANPQEAITTVQPEPVSASQVQASVAEAPAVSATIAITNVFAQIRGISEKRAEQLKTNGITTIQELANAVPDELAAKLGISPKIVKMWIGSAKKLVK